MYSHYGINPYASRFGLRRLVKLIVDANEKNMEDKLWQRWLVDYSRMNDGSNIKFMSFEEYKKKLVKSKTNNKVDIEKVDVKKIIEDAEVIKKADQERGN